MIIPLVDMCLELPAGEKTDYATHVAISYDTYSRAVVCGDGETRWLGNGARLRPWPVYGHLSAHGTWYRARIFVDTGEVEISIVSELL